MSISALVYNLSGDCHGLVYCLPVERQYTDLYLVSVSRVIYGECNHRIVYCLSGQCHYRIVYQVSVATI